MSEYLELVRHGAFKGMLRWEQLDALWEAVRGKAAAGWYPYAMGEPPPSGPVDAEELRDFVGRVDGTLRKLHTYDHCGLVYVDRPGDPEFLLIFHPHRMGGCGTGKWSTIPGWTLSLLPPVDLPAALSPPPAKGFLSRIFESMR